MWKVPFDHCLICGKRLPKERPSCGFPDSHYWISKNFSQDNVMYDAFIIAEYMIARFSDGRTCFWINTKEEIASIASIETILPFDKINTKEKIERLLMLI